MLRFRDLTASWRLVILNCLRLRIHSMDISFWISIEMNPRRVRSREPLSLLNTVKSSSATRHPDLNCRRSSNCLNQSSHIRVNSIKFPSGSGFSAGRFRAKVPDYFNVETRDIDAESAGRCTAKMT